MSERLWKKTERAIAHRLGGRRVPVTGRARGDVPDISHPWLAVEVKTRQALPQWLKAALQQAKAAASEGRLPVVVLHEVGCRHDGDLVLLTLQDFVERFGDGDGTD